MIISIAISGTGTGYPNGGAASASCTGIAGCTGSGFAGTCVGNGAAVTSITITNPGTGYKASAPPAIACGSGSGHSFTPTVDTILHTAVAIREDTGIDFSGDGVGHIAGTNAFVDYWPWKGLRILSSSSTVYANANFAARWNGLIEPLHNHSYFVCQPASLAGCSVCTICTYLVGWNKNDLHLSGRLK